MHSSHDGARADRLNAVRFYALLMLDHWLRRGAPGDSPLLPRRQRLVDEAMSAQGFTAPRSPAALPELPRGERGRRAFLEATQHMHRPIVVRGFARDLPAVKQWDRDYLRRQLRGSTCVVWGGAPLRWEQAWSRGLPSVELPFEGFIDRMAQEPLYLANSPEIFRSCEALRTDLGLERINDAFFDTTARWKELSTTQVFIGSQLAGSPLHAAMGGNFFLQLRGRKRWTLISPEHTMLVHPVPARPFQYALSAHGSIALGREGEGEDNPLRRLPRYEVVLEPGDLLFNAAWWWHEVENLDPLTIGCAVRHAPPPQVKPACWDNHPLFTATSVYPALRAAVYFHYYRHRLTGNDTPLYELLNRLVIHNIRRSLDDRPH